MIRARVRARADPVAHDRQPGPGRGVEEQVQQVPLLRLIRHVGDEVRALERKRALRYIWVQFQFQFQFLPLFRSLYGPVRLLGKCVCEKKIKKNKKKKLFLPKTSVLLTREKAFDTLQFAKPGKKKKRAWGVTPPEPVDRLLRRRKRGWFVRRLTGRGIEV